MSKSGPRAGAFVFFMVVILAGSAFLLRGFWLPPEKTPPESTTLPADGSNVTISLSEEKAKELLAPYLAGQTEIELASLRFANGHVAVDANVDVEWFISETVAKAMPELAMVKDVLPKQADVSMEFTPSLRENKVFVQPVSCRIGSYVIPVGLIPARLIVSFNDMLQEQINRHNVNITSVSAENGVLTVAFS